jgi:hypothetical protein
MLIEGALAALVVTGVGSYLLSGRGGQSRKALVLYTAAGENVGEFQRNAGAAARLFRTRAVPITDGQTLLRAVRSAPRGLSLVLMVGHGSGGAFFRPGHAGLRIDRDALPTWLGDDSFASALAPKLARDFVVSLAGCRAGAEYSEPDWTTEAYWTGTTTGTGGARSLAAQIRDALARAGANNGEVRAHTTTGGVFANPAGRTFVVARGQVGRPGAALIDLVLGAGTSRDQAAVRSWNTTVRGGLATRWMLGGDAPTRSELLGGGEGGRE